MKDKVALVTGAGRGIGREIALTLARECAAVVLVDRVLEGITTVATEIAKLGGTAQAIQADVTVVGDIEAAVSQTLGAFGRIDILVNNAGTIRPADFLTMSEEDWDFIQRVDLKGLALFSQKVAPHMITQRYGKIVNISSMSGGSVYMPGFASYSAAKAGVNNLTQTMARELGPYGINVNAVAPGEILTDLTYQDQTPDQVERKLERSREMTMLQRLGTVTDVAELVLFLCSDRASFITGVVVPIDGGRIDRM
jgi:3-oxoacyl-[acyl-carrier protein] reductase